MDTAFKAMYDDQALVGANGNNYEPLDNLASACERFVDWAQHADGSDPTNFDAAAGQMHSINFFIAEAERSGHENQEILAVLQEVREVQAGSTFRFCLWER